MPSKNGSPQGLHGRPVDSAGVSMLQPPTRPGQLRPQKLVPLCGSSSGSRGRGLKLLGLLATKLLAYACEIECSSNFGGFIYKILLAI